MEAGAHVPAFAIIGEYFIKVCFPQETFND